VTILRGSAACGTQRQGLLQVDKVEHAVRNGTGIDLLVPFRKGISSRLACTAVIKGNSDEV